MLSYLKTGTLVKDFHHLKARSFNMKVMQVVVLPMSNLEEGKYVTEAMFRHKDNATPQELADLVNSLIKLTLIGPGQGCDT